MSFAVSASAPQTIAALDIGGTKLAACLVTFAGAGMTLSHQQQVAMPADRRPEAVVAAAAALIQALPLAEVRALGVAATGSVAAGRVTALNSATLQDWHGFDLQNALYSATNLATTVLNDADAAAWGEATWGAGRAEAWPDLLFITVSTGVGGGLLLDGRLRQSRHGLHSEVGFMRSQAGPDGQALEYLASGAALDGWAAAQGWGGGSREVVARAEAGEQAASARLDESAALVAAKIADLKVALGLDGVVIGGGLGLAAGYLGRLRSQLALLPALYHLPIKAAALGSAAGLVGAAAWVMTDAKSVEAQREHS
jgi:predicted NBD/HSP70 family sugar kinase